jgi:hypothetical protein
MDGGLLIIGEKTGDWIESGEATFTGVDIRLDELELRIMEPLARLPGRPVDCGASGCCVQCSGALLPEDAAAGGEGDFDEEGVPPNELMVLRFFKSGG